MPEDKLSDPECRAVFYVENSDYVDEKILEWLYERGILFHAMWIHESDNTLYCRIRLFSDDDALTFKLIFGHILHRQYYT